MRNRAVPQQPANGVVVCRVIPEDWFVVVRTYALNASDVVETSWASTLAAAGMRLRDGSRC